MGSVGLSDSVDAVWGHVDDLLRVSDKVWREIGERLRSSDMCRREERRVEGQRELEDLKKYFDDDDHDESPMREVGIYQYRVLHNIA